MLGRYVDVLYELCTFSLFILVSKRVAIQRLAALIEILWQKRIETGVVCMLECVSHLHPGCEEHGS